MTAVSSLTMSLWPPRHSERPKGTGHSLARSEESPVVHLEILRRTERSSSETSLRVGRALARRRKVAVETALYT